MTRPELSYDSHGINGPDEYRSRVATFAPGAARDKYGPLFEASPDLLAALIDLISMATSPQITISGVEGKQWKVTLKEARDAIARATGAAQ